MIKVKLLPDSWQKGTISYECNYFTVFQILCHDDPEHWVLRNFQVVWIKVQFWQRSSSVRLKKAILENMLHPTKYFMNFFGSIPGHFIVYLRCRETVELFRFLLPPYILIETCNNVLACIFFWLIEMCRVNLGIISEGHGIIKLEKPCYT